MNIAILGAGAVGIGLASALAREGETLRVFGRDPETLEQLRHQGIERSGLFPGRRVEPDQLSIESSLDSLAESPPDFLLICTKAFATAEVAASLQAIAPRPSARTKLVLCQNGWGNEAPFLPFWPEAQLFHARIITGFHRRTPHAVEITAHAAPIALGSIFGKATGSLQPLAERISAGGIPAEVVRDMRGVLWAKMLYNCALNPLGALAGRRYGELTRDPVTCALVETVIREIFEVLDRAGVPVAWPDADRYLETFHRELIPPTAAHESSMLQDLRAGRRTEIDALCGAVERWAADHDVPTPVVSALAVLVRAAEGRGH